jgi:hypothetical protein
MYLHEFCGSWMEHPFLRTRLLLDQPRDLERLLATTIRQVWIDTGKGADIAPDITPAEVLESPGDEAVPSSPVRPTRTSVEKIGGNESILTIGKSDMQNICTRLR